MPGIQRDVAEHSLDIRAGARPVKQPLRRFDEEKRRAIGEGIVILKLYTKCNRESSSFCMSYLHHKKSTYVIESD
jgi:hypothetical protein